MPVKRARGGGVIGNMLLRPRDQSGLLQKVQGEEVQLSPGQVSICASSAQRPQLLLCYCFSTHVVNSLEHRKREDSDRKASIPLRESNYFMMPGCSSENPAAPLMWKNMASPQFLRL